MAGLTKEQQDVLNNPARRRDVLKQIEHIAASGQSDDFEGDVGPWMNTPLGKEAKSAWDRGMSKRKSEDNRDVWDKVVDWAPTVGGAILGGAFMRKSQKLGERAAEAEARRTLGPKRYAEYRKEVEPYERGRGKIIKGVEVGTGAAAGASVGTIFKDSYDKHHPRRRK